MVKPNNFIQISESTEEERDFIEHQLINFNRSQVPFLQDQDFERLDYSLKNHNGQVLGGIVAIMYCWKCVYLDLIWIDSSVRHEGYGSKLLLKLETEAKARDCSLIHLDTFDFQAKDFYLKHGYEVFGVLENCPPGHKRFYLKKDLSKVGLLSPLPSS